MLKFYDEVFKKWDLSNIDLCMHEGYTQHNKNVESAKSGFIKFCDKFLSLKPHMEIYHILSEGDKVCVFFKCTLGSNAVVNKVFDMYRIKDGKLAEHWDCVERDVGNIVPVHKNGLF